MKTRVQTKTKLRTQTVVALGAGAVILAAAAAGGLSGKGLFGGGLGTTPGYAPVPSEGHRLEITFASPKGSTKIHPGDRLVNLGEYEFKAVGGDVAVNQVYMTMLSQDTSSSSAYVINGASNVFFSDHFENCVLKNVSNGYTVSGPIGPYGFSSTQMEFADQFMLSSGQKMKVRLECDVTGLAPNGSYDRFAVSLLNAVDVQAVDPPIGGSPVGVVLNGTNGNPPRMRVQLVP